MGRASGRLAHLRCGLRTDAPARGSTAWRHRGGDPAVVVRGAREHSCLGLCRGAGFCRLPGGAKHHPGHRDDDCPEMADVPDLDWRGHFFLRQPRLCARPLESASGHDGGLGLVARRGDRHGADGQRLRRRHEAGRRDAISARRLRWTLGVGSRPGVVGVGGPRRLPLSIGSRLWRPDLSWGRWPWASAARSLG